MNDAERRKLTALRDSINQVYQQLEGSSCKATLGAAIRDLNDLIKEPKQILTETPEQEEI